MKLLQVTGFILASQLVLVSCLNETWDQCGNDLSQPTGLDKFIDVPFLEKFFRNLLPFTTPDLHMQFYLYKKDFPNCGQEIRVDDDSLQKSGFNPTHPTRILIHGWMSQSKTAFNRNIKDAYFSLGDFNVIVVDWSIVSSTLNYFKVVQLIEGFGEIVGGFAMHLHKTLGVDYDNMYLIGHSLGAQIAGSAGKFIYPAKFNTIYALDPAGPAFRGKPMECRIDATDAKYVESIQTSVNLGFLEPVGSATFFPNKGVYQKCLNYGCSHRRAYQFFAESLTSPVGFWGTRCDQDERKRVCPEMGPLYKMGGEPSEIKNGTFYVKTRATSPYALGKYGENVEA